MSTEGKHRSKMFGNEAEFCRHLGWGPGTYLAGDEGYGVTVILITALGERGIFAREISHDGKPSEDREATWTLSMRDWEKVEAPPAPLLQPFRVSV